MILGGEVIDQIGAPVESIIKFCQIANSLGRGTRKNVLQFTKGCLEDTLELTGLLDIRFNHNYCDHTPTETLSPSCNYE